MKAVIVTGAGTGLGAELAKLYAKDGYYVYLLGRTEKTLESVQQDIQMENGESEPVCLDIRNEEGIKRFIQSIPNGTEVSFLINNAGTGIFGPFLDSSEAEMKLLFETNTYGTINMTKAVLPLMQKAKKGIILTIISTAGLRGKKNESIYAASKFAVRGFTESLQKEFKDSGIRFVSAYMGGMDTPFWNGSNHVADKSRFRSAIEVAELLHKEAPFKDEIIIESKNK